MGDSRLSYRIGQFLGGDAEGKRPERPASGRAHLCKAGATLCEWSASAEDYCRNKKISHCTAILGLGLDLDLDLWLS